MAFGKRQDQTAKPETPAVSGESVLASPALAKYFALGVGVYLVYSLVSGASQGGNYLGILWQVPVLLIVVPMVYLRMRGQQRLMQAEAEQRKVLHGHPQIFFWGVVLAILAFALRSGHSLSDLFRGDLATNLGFGTFSATADGQVRGMTESPLMELASYVVFGAFAAYMASLIYDRWTKWMAEKEGQP